jgi:sugar lactone lactonase YvrE
MVAASTGIITTVAGNGSTCSSLGGDGGPATAAALCYPNGLSVDGKGNVYITDSSSSRIRELRLSTLPPASQTASPVFSDSSGTYSGPQTVTVSDSTPGAAIYLTLDGSTPSTAGAIYKGPISVTGSVTINALAVAPGYTTSPPAIAAYTITSQPTAVITTIAGNGISGYLVGAGDPLSTPLRSPNSIGVDREGNVFFDDNGINVVWEISSATGEIATVPGLLNWASPQLILPTGLALDATGNLYVASVQGVVIKVAAESGVATIFAGTGLAPSGYPNLGDYGPATSAALYKPQGLAIDSAGDMYIADNGDNLVRMVAAGTGIITSVAGRGGAVSGGLAVSTEVYQPSALALDSSGNLYIAVPYFGLVYKITKSTGIITTVAGNGIPGSSGNGGSALSAEINPQGLAVDAAGNLYISDPAEIRMVFAGTGIISRFAGTGYLGFSGDGGSATMADISNPQGLAFDAAGNLYLSDQGNHRVRKVTISAGAGSAPAMTVTPSAASITTEQTLSVTVAMQPALNPLPTGSVTLTSGSYNAQQTLANGAVIFNMAAGSLPLGANTLTATYAPDPASSGIYATASQKSTVTVTSSVGAAVATVILSPSAATITDQQAITVGASVTGPGGQATPTGTVTLTGGSYSSQQQLANGAATFSVPAGAFTAAASTATASYSGDGNYASAMGTTGITLVPILLTASAASSVAPGNTASTMVSLAAGSHYSGTLNLSCALIASLAGAQSLPKCSVIPASVNITSGGQTTITVTISTTAPSSASALERWGGSSVLALVVLFFIPSLRRRKTTVLLLAFVFSISVAIGCGGHSGAGSTAGSGSPAAASSSPATSPGVYTFRVAATDASQATLTGFTDLTITVQ